MPFGLPCSLPMLPRLLPRMPRAVPRTRANTLWLWATRLFSAPRTRQAGTEGQRDGQSDVSAFCHTPLHHWAHDLVTCLQHGGYVYPHAIYAFLFHSKTRLWCRMQTERSDQCAYLGLGQSSTASTARTGIPDAPAPLGLPTEPSHSPRSNVRPDKKTKAGRVPTVDSPRRPSRPRQQGR